MYTLLWRSLQRNRHFAYTEAGTSVRSDVYASMQKPSVKASFCVYRCWDVCEGRCIRFLCRRPQWKHYFAYTEIGASARGDVYASIQKLSVKASFCVYRYRGVDVYASAQKSSAKASFCVYKYWVICKGRCIRIYAEALSESAILRIQMLGHIGGVFVYAFIQEPSMKALFCVYRNRGICKRWCIRFYEEAFSESVILRMRGSGYWEDICAEAFSESIILRIQK